MVFQLIADGGGASDGLVGSLAFHRQIENFGCAEFGTLRGTDADRLLHRLNVGVGWEIPIPKNRFRWSSCFNAAETTAELFATSIMVS